MYFVGILFTTSFNFCTYSLILYGQAGLHFTKALLALEQLIAENIGGSALHDLGPMMLLGNAAWNILPLFSSFLSILLNGYR